jgi:hypothetical protein
MSNYWESGNPTPIPLRFLIDERMCVYRLATTQGRCALTVRSESVAFPTCIHEASASQETRNEDSTEQEDIDSCSASLDRRSVRMILIVDDPDALFEQAIAAGATQVFAAFPNRL